MSERFGAAVSLGVSKWRFHSDAFALHLRALVLALVCTPRAREIVNNSSGREEEE